MPISLEGNWLVLKEGGVTLYSGFTEETEEGVSGIVFAIIQEVVEVTVSVVLVLWGVPRPLLVRLIREHTI